MPTPQPHLLIPDPADGFEVETRTWVADPPPGWGVALISAFAVLIIVGLPLALLALGFLLLT